MTRAAATERLRCYPRFHSGSLPEDVIKREAVQIVYSFHRKDRAPRGSPCRNAGSRGKVLAEFGCGAGAAVSVPTPAPSGHAMSRCA